MRNTTRLVIAGFVSVLALGIAPVATIGAAPVTSAAVGCCR
jgi:hypothetical protein